MRALLLLVMVACDFSASSRVVSADSAQDSGTVDDGSADSDSEEDTQSDEEQEDQDGDGYTEAEGDCDDQDDTVAPGLEDTCDGKDSDCDGEVDEDAAASDGYEPNDSSAWSIGTLSDGDAYSLVGTLHNDEDVDRFEFSMVDRATNLFELEVVLEDIPAGAIYGLEVTWLDEDEEIFSDSGSDSLSTSYGDSTLSDETGEYRVEIRSLGGTDCSESYRLRIDYLEWGW